MAQPLRMSGMNSGLDTESIINALTANSKLKITKQERQLLKYQATQDAYRDVISKFQGIQDKYFDILNKKTNLKGSTMWNQYSTKTIVDGAEKAIAGLSLSTSINSTAGSYKINVKNTATQSTLKGSSLSGGAKVDLYSFEEGKEYGFTITVGDETANITFTGGADATENKENIREALTEVFGESNSSAANSHNAGMVYVDTKGNFVSRAGKGITISGVSAMESSATLDLSGIKSGNNSISVRVGEEVLNLSFQTLEDGYFDEIFDGNGEIKTENLTKEQKAKVELYNEIKEDYIEKQKYDEYQAWEETATDEDKAQLKQTAFDAASEKHRAEYLDKYLDKKYKEYEATVAKGETKLSLEDWKSANYAEGDTTNELYNGFVDYYYDKDATAKQIAERDAAVTKYLDEQYDAYAAEAGGDAVDKDTWKAAVIAGEEGYEKATEGYNKIYNDKKYKGELGYELDFESWGAVSYNEYEAYKENLGTVKDEDVEASLTAANIVDHYNETALNNSIGAAETKSGVKLSVAIEGDTVTITAADKDGNGVGVSVTGAQGSTNDFGVEIAQNSISQISNSTVLSDLGLTADENGKFNFTINGVDFSFKADTNIKEMMRTVNASEAGVKMTYSSLDNAFTVTSNEYGVNSSIEIDGDPQGLMSALGLSGGTYTQGSNLQVEINGKSLESDGNSIEADGTTFTFAGVEAGKEFTVEVEKDNSAIADTIKSFVEDYNKLIEEVYKYLDEEPDEDYYFLADQDRKISLFPMSRKKSGKKKPSLVFYTTTQPSVL